MSFHIRVYFERLLVHHYALLCLLNRELRAESKWRRFDATTMVWFPIIYVIFHISLRNIIKLSNKTDIFLTFQNTVLSFGTDEMINNLQTMIWFWFTKLPNIYLGAFLLRSTRTRKKLWRFSFSLVAHNDTYLFVSYISSSILIKLHLFLTKLIDIACKC